jgi:hypothetical protein
MHNRQNAVKKQQAILDDFLINMFLLVSPVYSSYPAIL